MYGIFLSAKGWAETARTHVVSATPSTFEICRQNRSEATSRKTERLGLLKHAWSRSIRTRPVRTMTGTVHHAVSLLGYPPTRSKHLPISGSSDIPVVETTENEDSDTSSVSDPVMALFEQNLAPDWEVMLAPFKQETAYAEEGSEADNCSDKESSDDETLIEEQPAPRELEEGTQATCDVSYWSNPYFNLIGKHKSPFRLADIS
jgi:hypothetical protein